MLVLPLSDDPSCFGLFRFSCGGCLKRYLLLQILESLPELGAFEVRLGHRHVLQLLLSSLQLPKQVIDFFNKFLASRAQLLF